MKKLALAVALLGLLVAGQGAQAVIGTVDDVPSATLLLPYFEITQGSPDSIVRGFDGIFESSPATSATWAPPVNTSWIDRELMYHAQRHGYTHADLKSWPGILPARLLRT